MNAITIIEAAPTPATLEDWIAQGRALVAQRLDNDWRIADWMAEGKTAGHLTQAKFDFLQDNLGLAPKRLKDALKAATTFPPALRDSTLSVEHHAAVASLPKDEALPLLKRAAREHLSVNDCREVVTQRRYETGQRFDDEDTDTTLATLIRRAWNRATEQARREAYEDFKIAAGKGFSIIDEDETRA
ncbi:hypothetical protein V474_07815 [Novosphingobium barchaimii LL02]|uniref:DUF222 domain-containing protein n=1 Tax=Novosphingobium barchaimii LL02 TaxID=1114963 RepID=A0A0J7Y9I8_9SPHN|nr:hypothetical protein [Novosphingobium barchaimii]KMS59988.1 hypothetical protein V474_07815 [Novosphingobium barchaimii LL02]